MKVLSIVLTDANEQTTTYDCSTIEEVLDCFSELWTSCYGLSIESVGTVVDGTAVIEITEVSEG